MGTRSEIQVDWKVPCPVCGRQMLPNGMASHHAKMHGSAMTVRRRMAEKLRKRNQAA